MVRHFEEDGIATVLGAMRSQGFGEWIARMMEQIQGGALTARIYNAAPMSIVGVPLSIMIGLLIAWFAVRKHDPMLGIYAWVFFVPYLALYGMLLYLSFLAIRWPRATLIVSLALWIVYGWLIGNHLLSVLAR